MLYSLDFGGNMSFLIKAMDALDKMERGVKRIAGGQGMNFEKFGQMARGAEAFNNSLQQATGVLLDRTKEAAQLSDRMAIVQKNTGLADSEMKSLRASLDNLDTRTSTDDLLTMASMSGKLGVPKQEIVGFVQSVNKAKIALGDEFGNSAEAVAMTLGKIKGQYKEFANTSFEQSFLSLGSAINYLGKQGANSAPVVGDFMQRVSTMGFSAAQAAGFGASLEELGLPSEIASGGLKAILNTAKTESVSFAKYLRISNKEWEYMLNTDPSAAVIKLSKSFKGATQTQIAQTLKELGISSQEAQQVMSLLANNTDMVTQRQTAAAMQIKQKTDLDKEAALMGGTLGAQMDKTQKRFDSMAVSVGQMLAPYAQSIQLTAGLGSILAVSIPFVSGMSGALSAGGKWALQYVFGLKLMEGELVFTKASFVGAMASAWSFSTTLLTSGLRSVGMYAASLISSGVTAITSFIFGQNAATTATWAFNASLYANPIGLVVGLIIALGAALVMAYYKIEGFRKIVDASMYFVRKAIDLVVEGVEWLLKYLGLLGDEQQQVKVDVDTSAAESGMLDMYSKAGIQLDANGNPVMDIQANIKTPKVTPLAIPITQKELVQADMVAEVERNKLFGNTSLVTPVYNTPLFLRGSSAMTENDMPFNDELAKRNQRKQAKKLARQNAETVSGGGSKPVNIKIELEALVKGLTVQSTNIQEGASKVRDILIEELMTVLNSTTQFR